jgi:hypothetical protein
MAVKSGSDFNDAYNGSIGNDGETRSSESMGSCGPWGKLSPKSDGVRTRTSDDGEHTLIGHGNSNRETFDQDHLHFYNDKSTGERTVEDKASGEKYISEQFADAVKNFMGW